MDRQTYQLDTISIATPCSADWNEMKGDDRSRFCSHCSLNVYNLSAMSREEAASLVSGADGRVCVRFYRRADDTVLTEDCPVGLRAVRQRMVRRVRSMVAAAATFVAGVVGISGASASEGIVMGRKAPGDQTPRTEQPVDSTQTEPQPEEVPVESFIMGGLMPPPEMGEVAPHQPADSTDEAVEQPVDEPIEISCDDEVAPESASDESSGSLR
jgi:hypothetical protein